MGEDVRQLLAERAECWEGLYRQAASDSVLAVSCIQALAAWSEEQLASLGDQPTPYDDAMGDAATAVLNQISTLWLELASSPWVVRPRIEVMHHPHEHEHSLPDPEAATIEIRRIGEGSADA